MIVLGLDPGTEQSALVMFDGSTIGYSNTLPNDDVLALLALGKRSTVLVIEKMEGFGMPVGREVLRTVFWSGRFAQEWYRGGRRFDELPRRDVKLHICHSPKANDASIRQALIDRFGGKDKAFGKKRAPGVLFGITGHKMAALAVAVTYYDQHVNDREQVRPGISAQF